MMCVEKIRNCFVSRTFLYEPFAFASVQSYTTLHTQEGDAATSWWNTKAREEASRENCKYGTYYYLVWPVAFLREGEAGRLFEIAPPGESEGSLKMRNLAISKRLPPHKRGLRWDRPPTLKCLWTPLGVWLQDQCVKIQKWKIWKHLDRIRSCSWFRYLIFSVLLVLILFL